MKAIGETSISNEMKRIFENQMSAPFIIADVFKLHAIDIFGYDFVE